MIKPRRIRWVENVAPTREKRNAYRISVGKSQGKRPLGRWEDNIKITVKKRCRMGWYGLN
jgi:hypothetical protein